MPPPAPLRKKLVSAPFALLPHALPLGLSRLLQGGPMIRAVLYHGTPKRFEDSFRRHLRFYRKHYDPIGPVGLRRVLAGGGTPTGRPGILLSFDDGFRDNFTVGAPLLEEHGFTGWFFVPSDLVADRPDPSAGDGERITWDELRQLAARHVVGSHTRTHVRLPASVGTERLRDEIVGSRRALEERLGCPVESFCWVGGEEDTYSPEAAGFVREAGYSLAFQTNNWPITRRTDPLQLQRSNVEVEFPMSVVAFQLSGLMDVLYIPKRSRVEKSTSAPPSR
jgi:peptidoglycan/xylan/chitin deacetylase (PgdA/CDA1 family)